MIAQPRPVRAVHRRPISNARATLLSSTLIKIYGMPEGYGIECAGGVDYSGSTWRARDRSKLFTIDTEASWERRQFFLTIHHTHET